MMRSLLVGLVAMAAGFGALAQTQPGGAPDGPDVGQPAVLSFAKVVQRGDHFVFVGDDMTQQMFYTRAVGAALLALQPTAGLRWYNGGWDGAKAGDALKWVDGLFELSQPTVVFVCFGLNEAAARGTVAERVRQYQADLTALVTKIKAHPGVRQVIVLSPPALQGALDETLDKTSHGAAVLALARAAREVAVAQQTGFIDLHTHLSLVHETSIRAGGGSLTVGGRLPSEEGHAVIASMILAGIGVTAEQLDAVKWSPLKPRRMGVVRGALALRTRPVADLEAAQMSEALYEGMRKFDEIFFQLWRLSSRRPTARPREALLPAAEEAWNAVAVTAKAAYGPGK